MRLLPAKRVVLGALLVSALACVEAAPAMAQCSTSGAIVGTAGPDVLVGTQARDVICGLGGNDVIRGLRGDDAVYGGDGADTLLTGDGRDFIVGGPGLDVIHSGEQNDVVNAIDEAADFVECAGGYDRLYWDVDLDTHDSCEEREPSVPPCGRTGGPPVQGPVVVVGQGCQFIDATINGDVVVAGGTAYLENTVVHGSISAAVGHVGLCGGTVDGPVTLAPVAGYSDYITGGGDYCAPLTLGSLHVSVTDWGPYISGVTVRGSVVVDHTGRSIGPHYWTGGSLRHSQIGGSVTFSNNGRGQTAIAGNVIGGNLVCVNNDPDPVNRWYAFGPNESNTVHGTRVGETCPSPGF